MRDNDEDGGETVNPIDLLVPGVGEIVGESQRVRLLLIMCICVGMLNSHTKMLKLQQEERLDVLIEKIKDLELDVDDYWWYLDLRRFGSVPHAGYGLGFERLVTM
jgi:asparaginyl-tRNA synthetase